MGASGSGKTTLLNVLNFRNRSRLKINGDVRINGKLVETIEEISTFSGYVQQDDLFIGSLKVKEHLLFQARLKMDRETKKDERDKRINHVLNYFNLMKCKDSIIGIPERGIKGISGGEKRRLSFASEVITNPSILFCDEPTSGLDSFEAARVVESMKNLALNGKTIIFTIHQPSSELFELFDKICLITEGRCAFIGDKLNASKFFESQGFICPLNYNPADFFIKTLAISPINRDECQERVNVLFIDRYIYNFGFIYLIFCLEYM